MKKMNRHIFDYDYNGTNIEWTWNVREIEKIYWKTWRPKIQNVKIIGLTDKKEANKLKKEIWESVIESEHPKKETKKGIYKLRK